jgi:hypothetical protein
MGSELIFTRSEIAKLYATFAYGGVPVDPTTLRVAIYFGTTLVLGPTTMTQISTGYYYYEFTVPVSWTEDRYSAVYTGIINGVSFKQEETFKVVASETVSSSALPTGHYCVIGDVEEELSGVFYADLPNWSTYVANLIVDTDHIVDRRCNRTFKQVRKMDYISGTGLAKMYLPNYPINEIHKCELLIVPSVKWYTFAKIVLINVYLNNGVAIATQSSEADFALCDLIVSCVDGIMTIPERVQYIGQSAFPFWNYTFIEGNSNIKVDYTYGFTDLTRPFDIKRLAAKLVARQILLRKGDQVSGGSVSTTMDGVGQNYDGVPFGSRIKDLDGEIEEIVRRYRRIGLDAA